MAKAMRSVLFVAIALLNISTELSAQEAQIGQRSKIALQAALAVNNPPINKWSPGIGGQFNFNYQLVKYFSLGTELGYQTVSFASTFGAPYDFPTLHRVSLGIHPKFTIPIEFESARLVPFLGFPLGIASTIINNTHSVGQYGGSYLGLEYLFSRNVGAFIQYGLELGVRYANPGLLWFSQVGAIGLIYNL